MVLTAPETVEIENLKHSHELQILNRKEEISVEEHKRDMVKLEMQREIASISTRADDRLIEVLERINKNVENLYKYGAGRA